MRFTCIDIGTVTARLALVLSKEGRLLSVEKNSVIVNLGEGLAQTGALDAVAVERCVATVAHFVDEARAWGASRACCTLTAAARRAGNAEVLLGRLRELGLDPEVIPGELEGTLTFLGVAQDFVGEPLLVVDSGGGSTELAYGCYGCPGQAEQVAQLEIAQVKSAPVGARVLTDQFLQSDPPTAAELGRARAFAQDLIADALLERRGSAAPRLVCVGGTATTLVALAKSLEPYDPAQVHLAQLSAGQVKDLTARLAALPVDRRTQLAGLQPKRAGVIVGGALCIGAVLGATGADLLTVSEHDLLWGLALTCARVLDGTSALGEQGHQAHVLLGWKPRLAVLR